MSSPYTVCDYLSLKGVCGKRCFGGRCNIHRNKKTLTYCKGGCGTGVYSRTGYCANRSCCGWKQTDLGHKMQKQEKLIEAYIQTLIAELEHPCPLSEIQPIAPTVGCGLQAWINI